MRRDSNNTTHHQCEITPGVYATFTALAAAIQDALVAAIAGIAEIASSAVAYSATTRFFTIAITMAGGVSNGPCRSAVLCGERGHSASGGDDSGGL